MILWNCQLQHSRFSEIWSYR